MIAVNVGDVIQMPNDPECYRVIAAGATTSDKGNVFKWFDCAYGSDDNRRIRVSADFVLRNLTTGGGFEGRRAACKFYHREAFNGYEREFGAETLPELYALMAAAGVKFMPAYPTVTEKGTTITVGNTSPAPEVEAALDKLWPRVSHTPAQQKLIRDALKTESERTFTAAEILEIYGGRGQRMIADATEPQHVYLPPGPIPPRVPDISDGDPLDTRKFHEYIRTQTAKYQAEQDDAEPHIDWDRIAQLPGGRSRETDPQPHVVGS